MDTGEKAAPGKEVQMPVRGGQSLQAHRNRAASLAGGAEGKTDCLPWKVRRLEPEEGAAVPRATAGAWKKKGSQSSGEEGHKMEKSVLST